MPEKKNQAIVDNYKTYQKVRYENKELVEDVIFLKDKGSNNANYKHGKSLVRSEKLEDIEFIVEANKKQKSRYGFKLRSKILCEKPFFRFDISGATHNNHSPLIPLNLRKITTPHFQYYDENGYNTAYKTDKLKDPNIIIKLREDLNKGSELFCQESRTFTLDNSFPTIQELPILLFNENQIDPLIDIDFDEA